MSVTRQGRVEGERGEDQEECYEWTDVKGRRDELMMERKGEE